MSQGIAIPALAPTDVWTGASADLPEFPADPANGTSFATLELDNPPHTAVGRFLRPLCPEWPSCCGDHSGSGSSMRILIAEDEIYLCGVLETALEMWGYEAVVVHDGLSAYAALRAADAPRLALLDWLMPGMDGIEVCRKLRAEADQPYTYLVMMTGQGGRQQMIDGLEAGANDFLIKPVDASELKARLATGRRLVNLQEQLRELALHDALTGLWNRAAILDLLNRELDRSRREKHPVSVILADLDHFKSINDTFGHLAGDHVLRQAAQRMQSVLRPYDTVGRYGGEEFLIVLPGCSSSVATGLAERLRRCLADEPMNLNDKGVTVTLSLGIAGAGAKTPAADLLHTADLALYQAKAAGRNCSRLGASAAGSPETPGPAKHREEKN